MYHAVVFWHLVIHSNPIIYPPAYSATSKLSTSIFCTRNFAERIQPKYGTYDEQRTAQHPPKKVKNELNKLQIAPPRTGH